MSTKHKIRKAHSFEIKQTKNLTDHLFKLKAE